MDASKLLLVALSSAADGNADAAIAVLEAIANDPQMYHAARKVLAPDDTRRGLAAVSASMDEDPLDAVEDNTEWDEALPGVRLVGSSLSKDVSVVKFD